MESEFELLTIVERTIMKIERIIQLLVHPSDILLLLARKGIIPMDDKKYMQKCFKKVMGYELNLENPQTFNEKLQWLKLYDRNEKYTQMVDKYEFKYYVTNIIDECHVIPTIGVWNNFDEIDFDTMPDKYVLKCTHDSGGVVIVKNNRILDKQAVRKKLEKSLKHNFFWGGREWPYKNVKPRIIAEQYLEVFEDRELVEYKIFCFNGIPQIVLVCKGNAHGEGRTNDFFYINFEHIPVKGTYPNSRENIEKPAEYEKMLELAKKISSGIPQVRVDFYLADGKIFIGETTFFHDGGYCKFDPPEWDMKFGQMIDLSGVK